MAAPPALTELADTYPNPSNAVFKAGITKLLNYAKGLLGATGNASEARDALGIGSAFGFRSRVRNGNFVVNQRLKSGSVVLTAGQYGHDGWKAGASGCTYTFATSGNDVVLTISAGSLIQTIEGALIEGGNYIMSWTGTAQGKIGAGSYAATGVAATGVTAATNLNIEFNTGTLSKVQLEPGTVVTPFERRHIAQELVLCKRYVNVWQSSSTSDHVGTGQCVTTTVAFVSLPFDVEMRAAPAAAVGSGSFAVSSANGSAQTVTAFGISMTSKRGVQLSATIGAANLVAGNASYLTATLATSQIVMSAEL